MERYNLRSTSLNDEQLTTELTKRGAQTFGTVKRKQQRLQRFLDAENHRQEAWTNLRITIQNEQRKVDARTELRRHILMGRSQTGRTSIYQLINEYLGY
jgi:hypothetical protein